MVLNMFAEGFAVNIFVKLLAVIRSCSVLTFCGHDIFKMIDFSSKLNLNGILKGVPSN